MKREWVKLYLPEPGSDFDTLPATAKAYAAILLNNFDNKGRLYCGSRDTVDAIAILLRADRGERRLLRKYIPMLLDPRLAYLVREGEHVRIRKFEKRQSAWGREDETTEPRTDNDDATIEQRSCNEESVSVRKDVRHDSCSLRIKKEEELDKEEEKEIKADAPQGALFDLPASDKKKLRDSEIRQVFDNWCIVFAKRVGTILDAKRRSKINARLNEEFSVEDLKLAALGASQSEFHVSNGHTDIVTIYKDQATVERHIARMKAGPSKPKGVAPAASHEYFEQNYTPMSVWEDMGHARSA